MLKLSPDGSRLAFATLLGGSSRTRWRASRSRPTARSPSPARRSRDFPVTPGSVAGAPRRTRRVRHASTGGAAPRFSRARRCGRRRARALAVDDEGCTYVTGRTDSHDFPTTLGALDRERCGVDAFVLKLSGGGRSLVYSTLLGGSQQDEGLGIAVDGQRRAVVVGWTQSLDFPFQSTPPDARTRPSRASASRVALVHATALGGGARTRARRRARERRLGLGRGPDAPRDLAVTGDARQPALAGSADASRARRAGGRPMSLRDPPRRRGRGRAVRRVLRSAGASVVLCGSAAGILPSAGRARGQVPRAVGCVVLLRSSAGAPATSTGVSSRGLSGTERNVALDDRSSAREDAAARHPSPSSPPRVVEPVQAAHVLGVEVRVDPVRDEACPSIPHGPQARAAPSRCEGEECRNQCGETGREPRAPAAALTAPAGAANYGRSLRLRNTLALRPRASARVRPSATARARARAAPTGTSRDLPPLPVAPARAAG